MNPITGLRNQLYELLTKARLKEAFDLLLKDLKTGTDVHQDVLILKSRDQNNEREYRNGTKNAEDYSAENNKIRLALLEIVNNLKPEDLKPGYIGDGKNSNGNSETSPLPSRRKWLIPILFLTGGVFLGAGYNYLMPNTTAVINCNEKENTIKSLNHKIDSFQTVTVDQKKQIDSLKNNQPLAVNKDNWENHPKTKLLKVEKDDWKNKYNIAEGARSSLQADLQNCKNSLTPKPPDYSGYTLYVYEKLDSAVENALRGTGIHIGPPLDVDNDYNGTILYHKEDQDVALYIYKVVEKFDRKRLCLESRTRNSEKRKIYFHHYVE